MNLRLKFAVSRLLACLSLLLFAAAPAHAIVAIPTTTYYFTADCDDCAAAADVTDYFVHGQLILSDTYVLGDTITSSVFVSFTYDGSNLAPAFTIYNYNATTLTGALPATLPGPPSSEILIAGGNPAETFEISTDGTWSLHAGSGMADYGTAATFGTPEPSTWAMLLMGFAGLGFAGYRSGRKRRAALAA